MPTIQFFDVDPAYIAYLKKVDNQVPNVVYGTRNKFVCGVVLNVNGYDYFAPVSSFNTQQKTNLLICDKGTPISSIRFCFMIPVPKSALTLTNFSKENQKYKDLVNAEIRFCNQNVPAIYIKAQEVYKIGKNRKHPLAFTCCDFTKLEEALDRYSAMSTPGPQVV